MNRISLFHARFKSSSRELSFLGARLGLREELGERGEEYERVGDVSADTDDAKVVEDEVEDVEEVGRRAEAQQRRRQEQRLAEGDPAEGANRIQNDGKVEKDAEIGVGDVERVVGREVEHEAGHLRPGRRQHARARHSYGQESLIDDIFQIKRDYLKLKERLEERSKRGKLGNGGKRKRKLRNLRRDRKMP